MKVHIIIHEVFEAPAAIETWFMQAGWDITYSRLYANETFPTTYDFDTLIIMGGPQSPSTTLEECPYFDAQKEIAFIREAINQKKKVLGICLGAQLIGEALDTRVERSPYREIGVFLVELTEDGNHEAIFSSFPRQFMVGHWHGDMPGLPRDASVLAVSAGCPRQIIRYTPNVYGFQCHFEFTPKSLKAMIEHSASEFEEYKNEQYIQSAEELQRYDFTEMNRLLFSFLKSFLEK